MRADEFVNENLHNWFKEKWVRFGPDGRIRGDCARGSDSEGKPKCLPQSKAHALGKKGRASAAARKRRQDPNAERSGPAKNVATKEAANPARQAAIAIAKRESGKYNKAGKRIKEGTNPADTLYFFDVAKGGRSFDHLDLRIMGLKQSQKGKWYYQPGRDSTDLLTNATLKHLEKTLNVPARAWHRPTTEDQIAEACWPGYHKDGMKTMFGKRYPNCVKNKKTTEDTIKEFVNETLGQKNSAEIRRIQQMLNKKFNANLDVDGVLGPLTKQSIMKFLPSADTAPAPDPDRTTRVQGSKKKVTEEKCPECGGPMFSELMITEKQDACYYKVKSRYKVWPSAYASGALVQCRKKGAANWGNKSK